jgi:hypothetical protein
VWGDNERTYYRDFDRRHAFTVTNSFHLGAGWSLGTVYTFHSGGPYTGQTWAPSESGRSWVLTEERPNGSRLPAYHRIDLRVLRKFRFDGWNLSVYAEGLNLTNHDNVLWYAWKLHEGESTRRPVRITRTGMPAVPSLGIEIEF